MSECPDNLIFVFGSNLSGIHGAGAAKHAKEEWEAKPGEGVGRTGRAYALPTKGKLQTPPNRDPYLPKLSLRDIQKQANSFRLYAEIHTELLFQLTAIGCGLAGKKPEQIAPLFHDMSDNVLYPPEWRAVLYNLPAERFWQYGQFGSPKNP
jgi:hypothetical protein